MLSITLLSLLLLAVWRVPVLPLPSTVTGIKSQNHDHDQSKLKVAILVSVANESIVSDSTIEALSATWFSRVPRWATVRFRVSFENSDLPPHIKSSILIRRSRPDLHINTAGRTRAFILSDLATLVHAHNASYYLLIADNTFVNWNGLLHVLRYYHHKEGGKVFKDGILSSSYHQYIGDCRCLYPWWDGEKERYLDYVCGATGIGDHMICTLIKIVK